MSLLIFTPEFQPLLRVLNSYIDGRELVPIALTSIRGIGRRISDMICKRAEISTKKRAGELTQEEVARVRTNYML